MTQPRHRIWLRARILPTVEQLLKITTTLYATEHNHLSLAMLNPAEACHVELTGLAHPCSAIYGAVGSNAPPESDVALVRSSTAAVGRIEAAERPISDSRVGGL
jgi:hypothetical protein